MALPGKSGQLLATINASTTKIETYLKDKGLPPLNFETESQLNILEYPPDVESARIALIEATRELNELAEGPQDRVILGQNALFTKIAVVRFTYHYKIYELVPLDGHISFNDLAQSTGLDVSALTQLLRAAASHHLFREDAPGFLSHTAATRFLRDSPSVQDWVGFAFEENLPSMLGIVDALIKYPQANDPATAAFMVINQAPEANFYDHLAKDPYRSKRFAGTMKAFRVGDEYSPRHVTNNFPWASLGNGTVIDIGGSRGDFAIEITKVAPELNLIVQDLPSVIVDAPPQEPGSRVAFMAYDFFGQQPVHDADVYYLRWILHNWPDAFALKILRNLIPALKTGAKVLIIDEIAAPLGSTSMTVERAQRLIDLSMLSLLNAKIRQLDEWETLIHTADPRFHIDRVTQPEGSNVAIIELSWRPQ